MADGFVKSFGYVPNPRALAAQLEKQPAVYTDQLNNLPYDLDKTTLTYRFLVRALQGSKWVSNGRLRSLNQGSAGTCVGAGTAGACDVTAACDIYMRGDPEKMPEGQSGVPSRCSLDWCYASGRHIANQLGSWQGSNGSWSVDALTQWGSIWSIKYGEYDLSEYSIPRTLEWARKGVPEPLKKAASENKFRAYVNAKTPEQACALIQNGYGVLVCSSYGFEGTRDEDGAIRIRGTWLHCMYWNAYVVVKRGSTKKRYFTNTNSWSDSYLANGGPLGPETPDMPFGSWNVHWDDAAKVLKAGDSWSVGGFDGFKRANWDWSKGFGW